MTEQDQPQGQPTPQAPTGDPSGTAETRQQEVTDLRKAAYGEVPPLHGLVATPGEVSGTSAPDVAPAVAPAAGSPSPSAQTPTEDDS